MKPALISGALLAFAMSGTQAVTFSNNVYNESIGLFGAYATPTYGQTFNLGAASVLTDWTFYGDGYATGGSNLRFVVATWDTSSERALGELYSTTGTWSSSALQFNGINLTLDAGAYIAYVTTSNVATDPVDGGSFESSLTGGASSLGVPLGGKFYYAQTGNNNDPLAPLYSQSGNNPWQPYFLGDDEHVAHMRLTANFDPVSVAGPLAPVTAVPEPSTYALMLVGLCGVGFMARRRKAEVV